MRQLKNKLKSRFPFLVYRWRQVRNFHLLTKSPEQVFTQIYRENKWEDKDSVSGPGSNLRQTQVVRRILPLLIEELNCKSLLDVPCGDFFWMKMVEMDIEYIGGDIVSDLTNNNQKKYGSRSKNRRFIPLDIIRDKLPKADLVLCRDCLVHLSYSDIFRALKNIKDSGCTYLLTTTSVEKDRNEDIPTGIWRPVNLQLPPFNLPTPMKLIDEEYPTDNRRDKNLGLWKTVDIPEFE